MVMAVAFAGLGLPTTSEQLQQLSKKLFPDGVYTEEFAKRASKEMASYAEHFESELSAELLEKPE
jgi:polyhydroxyalkanoate synthesis regulator phasin